MGIFTLKSHAINPSPNFIISVISIGRNSNGQRTMSLKTSYPVFFFGQKNPAYHSNNPFGSFRPLAVEKFRVSNERRPQPLTKSE